jgi:UDP-GlcNAc:undecaprenyl-phosphate/decaprenyl-phosphate GlcNAc-1-phosphate transferase
MIITIPLIFFGLSVGLTGLTCTLASRLRWKTEPTPNRLSAAQTPIWGGVAIFFTFLSSALFPHLLAEHGVILLTATATGAFMLGLIDDLWELRPRWKLCGQIVLSVLFLTFEPSISITGIKLVDLTLALLWMVGITNAFNLLDNINGLSAGTAVLVASFQSALYFLEGDASRGILCLGFLGTIMGFLVFNFPSGRIFMGDSGSHFIGFWLAGMTLSGINASPKNHIGSVLFPIILMVVPICDTTLVTLTRGIRRRPVSVGGTDHLSHRLVAYGFSERSAVLALWVLSLVSGILGILVVSYGFISLLSIVTLLLVAVALFGIYLTRFELRAQPSSQHGENLRPGIVPWVHIALRMLFDVVLIVAAYYTAFVLRFDGGITKGDMQLLLSTTAELTLIKLVVFIAFGAYRPRWEYFGLRDAYRVGCASLLASVIVVTYFSVVYRFYGFSRIVTALDFLVFTLLMLVFRFSFRLLNELAPANHRANVLIYGADDEGESALQLVSKRFPLRIVGFLDGDKTKRNLSIHSVAVRGGLEDLERLVKQFDVRAIILTPSSTADVQNQLQSMCRTLHIRLKRLHLELEDLNDAEILSSEKPIPNEIALVNAASSSR